MRVRLTTLLGLFLFLIPATAAALCGCFPCPDCDLRSFGQMNFVIMDRDHGRVQVIPNIRVVGEAHDFALVVPSPAVPGIEPVPMEIWDELLTLTRAVDAAGSGSGCFGGTTSSVIALSDTEEDAVEVLAEHSVGGFHAYTVRSDSPTALVDWLQNNGYSTVGLTAEILKPLVERGWVFTAMKLDTERVQVPDQWDTNVDPVMFVYPAENFDFPLPFFQVNRASQLPMSFFVVDDERTTLPGFETTYANRISKGEARGMSRAYPNVAYYVGSDRFLTRLDRTFRQDLEMASWMQLEQSPDQREFDRPMGAAFNSFPALLLGLVGTLMGWNAWQRRRALRQGSPRA